MKPFCRIEISYIDPDVYASLINHKLRKDILVSLYGLSLHGPISKQRLADALGIGYHQLVYQLNNHLSDFWIVAKEEKVRGTRKELIEPANLHAIFITLGKGRTIFLVDPLAGLFGPISVVGVRCDTCSREEVDTCRRHMAGVFCLEMDETDWAILEVNGREPGFKPLDIAILTALMGITSDRRFVVSIPCTSCAFLRRTIGIEGLE